MISFLRKTRKVWLSGNKIGSYMVYALGELILVVAGILIALSVNNWNINSNNLREAEEFILDLKYDLQTDTSVFNAKINELEEIIDYKLWGLRTTDFNNIPLIEVEGLTQVGYGNLKISMGTFIRMQNSYVWNVKEYENFFKGVNAYYTFTNPYLENFNEWEQEGHSKEIAHWYQQDKFEVDFFFIDSVPVIQDTISKKENLINYINSIEGRNYRKVGLMRDMTMKDIYQSVYDHAKSLLIEIEDLRIEERN